MFSLGLIGFVAVGISLGLLGGGGSILAVPLLVHVFGLPANEAVPMSLPIVGAVAAVGAATRWRSGDLRLGTAAAFAVAAMVTSFAAARLGAGIPDRPRLILFTSVMLAAAILMWRRATRTPTKSEAAPVSEGLDLPRLVPAALAVGALTGLVGVGGGFLIVPALVGVLALPMAQATATSLAVIALNTGAASAGWWGQSELDWGLTAQVTAAALVGMFVGIRLAPRIAAKSLTRAFAGLLLAVAVPDVVAGNSDDCSDPRCGSSVYREPTSAENPTIQPERSSKMLVRRFYDDRLAQAAYLIGCQRTGEAIVIDPPRDIRPLLTAAREEGVTITRVTETHIHADFVSGARELAAATDAKLLLSAEGGPDWQYGYATEVGATLLRDRDQISMGGVRIEVRHTPGHTPEHLVFRDHRHRSERGTGGHGLRRLHLCR